MIKKSISLVVACAAMVCMSNAGQAAVSIISSATAGGALSGATYVNFDLLDGILPGDVGGIDVSFVPNAQTATGFSTNVFAAPYLSGNNGRFFSQGNGFLGSDLTQYLTTGTTSITLDFMAAGAVGAAQTYFGLLWGSVDTYNTLTFHLAGGGTQSFSGSDVLPPALGAQGLGGTTYVNFKSTVGIEKVVATSSSMAFEFDNVAYGDLGLVSEVPEPASMAMWGIGALALVFARRKRRQ